MIKNIGSYTALSLTICFLLFGSFYLNKEVEPNTQVSKKIAMAKVVEFNNVLVDSIHPIHKPHNNSFSPKLGKSFIGFKEALGFKESRGDYFTVNTFGYLGKYQFGSETLKLIGIYNTVTFLNNPELQEKAFIANAERNKWILRRDIKRFSGKTINGVVITESGILAAAHLAGAGNVKKYLRSYGAHGVSDAFGTSIQHYIKKFSGYDTTSIKPNKKAKVKLTA